MRFRRWKRTGPSKDRYVPGDWNVIDDLAGFKMKYSETFKRWDGMLGPGWSEEQRHPQDFLRSVPDDTSVPDARPDWTPTERSTEITGDDL